MLIDKSIPNFDAIIGVFRDNLIRQQSAEALVGPIGSGTLMRMFATVSNGICLIVDGPLA